MPKYDHLTPAEQRAIAARSAALTTRLDALRLATERTITLLKERCSALVAEAVTGLSPEIASPRVITAQMV